MAQPNVLQTYFVAVNLMTGPMTRMQTGLMQMTAAAHQLNTAMAATNATLVATGTSALMAGAAIAIPLGLAANEAMKFEKAMGNVATLVDTAKESMVLMGDEVLDIAEKMPVPIQDLTKALYQIRSAGVPAERAMQTLNASAMLAVTGLGETREAADMLTTIMVDFRKEGLTDAEVADVLFKTIKGGKTTVAQLAPEFGKAALAAADVGVSFKELMAMMGAMTNTGVQTSEAQTAITQAMISMNKRTTEMITLQETVSGQLGITGQEFINFAGGAVKAMALIDAYAVKNRLDIFEVYGRKEGGMADIALIRNQRQKFEEMFTSMQSGNSIQEAYNKQMQTAASSMETAKNQLTILGIRIGGILLPALVKVGDVLLPVIEGLGNFAREHRDLTAIIVGGISTFALFALTVGSVSLAMSTMIKGMVMWKMVMGGYAMLMNRATSALVGFYMTVEMGNITLLSALGTLGIYAAAIGALAVMFGGKLYDNTKQYDKLLVQTKDGMKDLVKPTEQATIALNDYIDTKNRYQKTQNFQKFLDYERLKGGDFAAQRAILTNAIFSEDRGIVWNPQREAPKPSDFPGIDTAAAAKADSVMNVYVNTSVDKNGNSTTTVTNNGNIPINVRQTGVPQ